MAQKHLLGLFIYKLTEYSTIKSNDYDDAPDSLCGFCQHFIINTDRRNIITSKRRLPFKGENYNICNNIIKFNISDIIVSRNI